MKQKGSIFPVFFIFLILAILLFILPQKGITGFFEQATLPLRKLLFLSFHKTEEDKTPESQLRDENSKLLTELAKQKELEKENQALRDQFQTQKPSPRKLLPAEVVGMDTDQLIIDKGISDGVQRGEIVVYKDNLVGKIITVLPHLAIINLVTHEKVSFTAKDVKTSASGLATGIGGDGLILDGVVLSDKLERGDVLVTKGDKDTNGAGYPPDLVVGKIASVNKKASNLFQAAKVKTLIDFSKLEMVFVMRE